MTEGQAAWARACLALDLLAANPGRISGMVLRARAGPVRDVFLDAAIRATGARRIHALMPDETFFGGLDVTATLGEGRLVTRAGVIAADAPPVLIASAERLPPALAARIAAACDSDETGPLILLDEGTGDEAVPPALADRMALHLSLEGIGRLEAVPPPLARKAGPEARLPDEIIHALVTLAHGLGVRSLRAATLALRVAACHATWAGRETATGEDARVAAELVLAPRATRLPQDAPDQPPPPPPEDADADASANAQSLDTLPEDILVEAVRACLPDGLEMESAGTTRGPGGAGFGQRSKGNRRGRPLPSRPGRPGAGRRIDVTATLRAAAPWQKLRNRTGVKPVFRPPDMRVKRFETRSDRIVIFAVDASGSAALARLAEAKGAVELLLADAYARRDHVALVAFRGEGAELILPPTRSLTRTKRQLAGLPGGGGTPLAAGLMLALDTARAEARRGFSPYIAILTDGRANIAQSGKPDRELARADAQAAATAIAREGIDAVVLDTSRRPSADLAALARRMGARYLPLPQARAETMADALRGALPA